MKVKQYAAMLLTAAALCSAWAVPCGAETTTSATTTTTAATTVTTTRPVMDALQYEITDGEAVITAFSWLNETVVTIPDTIEGCPVTKIAPYAFQYCFADEVILPKTVREIGDYSFMGCEYLLNLTIPEDCAYIGYSAFQDCTQLKTVVIPETVSEIGFCAFEDTAFIRSITDDCIILGDGVLYAYQGGADVKDVVIPDTVKTIGYYAFADQQGIESITIPDSVTQIMEGAFDNCVSLGTIHAPATFARLEPDALYNTKWFREYKGDFVTLGDILVAYKGEGPEVTVPDSVAIIGRSAFEGNPFITTVHLPASVTEIRKAAFYKCSSLQVVTTSDSVSRIDDMAFYGCKNLKFINIGSKLEHLGSRAFLSCDALESLNLPVTVQSVGEYALGYSLDVQTDALLKQEGFTVYSNAEAVKNYGKSAAVAVEPYSDEVTQTTPEVTTTTTTTLSTARNAGSPTASKGWVIPVIIGAVLIVGGLVTICIRMRKKQARS